MTLEGFIIVVAIIIVSFFFLCWFDQRNAGLFIRTPDIKPPIRNKLREADKEIVKLKIRKENRRVKMRVKELIEQLSKLDPEKGIWCIYDSYALIDLVPDTTATEEEAEQFKNEGMEIGDYIINAW